MDPQAAYLRLTRGSLLLSAVFSLLFTGWEVSADTVSSFQVEDLMPTHSCKCSVHCRTDSCCCVHSTRTPKSVAGLLPGSSGRKTESDSIACLSQVPCGDSGLPGATPPAPVSRSAAIVHFSLCRSHPKSPAIFFRHRPPATVLGAGCRPSTGLRGRPARHELS